MPPGSSRRSSTQHSSSRRQSGERRSARNSRGSRRYSERERHSGRERSYSDSGRYDRERERERERDRERRSSRHEDRDRGSRRNDEEHRERDRYSGRVERDVERYSQRIERDREEKYRERRENRDSDRRRSTIDPIEARKRTSEAYDSTIGKSIELQDLNNLENSRFLASEKSLITSIEIPETLSINPAPSSPPNTKDRWFVLGSVLICVLLAGSQSSALIIAFPDLMLALDASIEEILWVLLAYMIVVGVFVALFGGASDIIGRKRLFNAGFAIFTASSLLCGFSQKKNRGYDLIAYRVLQGIGAASLFSNSSAILTDAFGPYNQVGLAMGAFMMMLAFGTVIGPLIGGGLHANWTWIFFINVPLGAIGTSLGLWKLIEVNNPNAPPKESVWKQLKHFDWIGSATLFCGICLFLLALTALAIPGVLTVAESAIFFSVGGGMLILHVVLELTVIHRPVVNYRIFLSKLYALSQFGGLCLNYVRGLVLFTSIFFFQGPYAYDPFLTGVLTIPYGGGILVTGFLSGKLADKYGPQLIQTVAPVISGVGCLGMCFIDGSHPLVQPLFTLFIAGLGVGLYNSANSMAGMVAVKREDRGSASGISTMFQMIAQIFALISLFGILTSQVPYDALIKLFLYGGGGENMDVVAKALHNCYYLTVGFSFAGFLAHFLFNFVIPPRIPFVKKRPQPQQVITIVAAK